MAYGSGLPLSCTAGYHASSGATRSSAASGTYRPETPVYAPNAVTGLSHTRVSDSRNSLSWTCNPTAVRPYSSVRVERSVDGGAWSEVASVPGAATGWDDLSASANHSYSYRARPANPAGYGPYSAATGRTYNTPAAPASVSAAVKSGTTVAVTVANPALTATSLELQKSADGESWAHVAAVEGSPVTSLVADLGGGSFWLRARNARGELKSAWTVSGQATVTECPPAPPTLVSPSSSQVVPTAAELSFSWLPSPPDGSAQTAAQVAYRLAGAPSWTAADAPGAAASLSVETPFPANSSCEWRARTKGSHAGWGAWSAASAFSVRTPPQAAFEEPAAGRDRGGHAPARAAVLRGRGLGARRLRRSWPPTPGGRGVPPRHGGLPRVRRARLRVAALERRVLRAARRGALDLHARRDRGARGVGGLRRPAAASRSRPTSRPARCR